MIVLLLVLIINIVMIVKPNNKKEVILDDVKLKEEISKNDSIAIMLEQSDGTYKESNESTFPINMMFNNEKSGCIDKEGQRIENSLTYSNGVVYVETNSTTYCYVYFDKMDIVSISVTTPPNKIKYDLGDTFDPTGMVVTAYYGDGTSKVITNYTYNIDGELSTENNSVTISYTENGITNTTTFVVYVTFPCIVKIKSNALGPDSSMYEKAYVMINGQVYKATEMTQSYESAKNVATLEVPSGTLMTCYANSGSTTFTPSISVNGENIASGATGIIEHDYVVKGDITVTLNAGYVSPMASIVGIAIIEDTAPNYNITVVQADDLGSISPEKYAAKAGEVVKVNVNAMSCEEFLGGTIKYVLNGEEKTSTLPSLQYHSSTRYVKFTMPPADVTITSHGFQWTGC